MKQRIYALTMILGISTLMLAACGNKGNDPAPAATQPIAASQETPADDDAAASVVTEPPANAAETLPAQGEGTESTAAAQPAANASISEADAQQTAFDHAGVTETDVSWLKVKLEKEDGRMIYDVEFYADELEYDYEIDATTGTILHFDYEWDDGSRRQSGTGKNPASQNSREKADRGADAPAQVSENAAAGGDTQGTSSDSPAFCEEDAIRLALEQVPGATEEHIKKFKTDYDKGRYVYEIEIRYGHTECELEIDAETGRILELEYDD